MKLGWAIVLGIGLGGGLAWWLSRDTPQKALQKEQRAANARAANAEDARPSLYRWRDASGVLQVTQEPPEGRKYERVDMEPREGLEIRGDRE